MQRPNPAQGFKADELSPDAIRQAAAAWYPQVVHWRRYLHAHPEPSFQETQTASYVCKRLTAIEGIQVEQPSPTSALGRLKGRGPGPVIALRADLDALPVQEAADIPFRSQKLGVMHACGHDGHIAILLGVAGILSQWRHRFCGEVRFIFQPAEELPPGGAADLIRAGILDGVQAILGTHLWVPLPVGMLGLADGPVMAATTTFDLTVLGRGGHAGQPHRAVDAIAVASQVVTHLQHLVARETDPLEPLVISVTRFRAGSTNNVIPELAELSGTVRSFNPSLSTTIAERMDAMTAAICQAHGASHRLTFHPGYGPVVNDPALTERIRHALQRFWPGDALTADVRTMAAEDFSAYQAVVPGCYLFVGAGNPEKGTVFPHHHPRFTIDEEALRYGMEALLGSVLALLKT